MNQALLNEDLLFLVSTDDDLDMATDGEVREFVQNVFDG
jgi:hypothetical protein